MSELEHHYINSEKRPVNFFITRHHFHRAIFAKNPGFSYRTKKFLTNGQLTANDRLYSKLKNKPHKLPPTYFDKAVCVSRTSGLAIQLTLLP